ncbi:hypothetical protein GCM10025771_36580 [Niveibacterium umoris]|uniref:Flagellar protein n=1 Tax=Niveibacterium umoris TaxID=1193620 RepID=A0A840BG26_9RHOO|nr:flagellar biosynthetic protein FliO [Niveibacterium umoris]MBB4011144.1 flagellar protein FliO/FliZ [Niveibacterium umoris]
MPKRIALALPFLIAPIGAYASVPDAGSSVLSMVIGLAVVLATLYGLLLALKRLQARSGNGQAQLSVIGGAAVGPRERVVLVEVGDTVLVLGVAPGRVSALHTLNSEDVPRATATPLESDFQRKLATLLKRGRHEA